MRKKLLLGILISIFSISLSACGNDIENQSENNAATTQEISEEENTPTKNR